MLVVGYLSNTATESRIVQIRISYAWVLYTSDLKRPKTVQVTEKEQLITVQLKEERVSIIPV